MSRTFRRKNQKHEYIWVLKDWDTFFKGMRAVHYSPNSPAGRKAIAVFHSDAQVTMASSAPVGIGGYLSIGAAQETTG